MLNGKKNTQRYDFDALQHDLKQKGNGTAQLIVDLNRLDDNIAQIKTLLPTALQPRLVVKSLASIELLQYIMPRLNCNRLMVFHAPHLAQVLAQCPHADILLGKPMPIKAVEQFYQHHQAESSSIQSIQWLIDSAARLLQYLNLAQRIQHQLRITIEIDVGLHRGGVSSDAEFINILTIIREHPAHLKLSGLMGYDAHVTKLPKLIKSVEAAFDQTQHIYRHYQDMIRHQFPQLWSADLCFNGGGSPTLTLHQQTACNDIAFGSVLLKPRDFEHPLLADFHAALWIATPILKVLPFGQLPAMDWLNRLPHLYQAAFVYGGYWQADYVYPHGARPHPLYGRSSNQEMVLIPRSNSVSVDDYVFLRPTQSERIIPLFGALYAYRAGQLSEWTTLSE